MEGVFLLFLASAALTAVAPADLGNEDLKPEASQQRIHDIIRMHEDYKYGLGNGDVDTKYRVDRPAKKTYHPVAIKSFANTKPYSYFTLSTPKNYDGEYQTLKPVSSKIYSYYPKLDSSEGHGGKRAVIYYPVKDQQYLQEPHYEKYTDQHTSYKSPQVSHVVHNAPVADHHQEAPEYVVVPQIPATRHNYEPVAQHQQYPVHNGHTEDHSYSLPVDDNGKYEEVHAAGPHYEHAAPAEHLYPVPRPKVIITKGPILTGHKETAAYGDHGYGHKESGYKDHGYAHHGDHGEHKLAKHHEHKDYEVKDHKSHAAHGGHHDEHSKYRNKGYYERDRGYHYEKAYAYDRIRAHHDIEKSHDAHKDYKSEHANHGHLEKGSKGSHGYMYFNKADHHGAHGHGKQGHYLDKHGHYKKGQHVQLHPVSHGAYGAQYAGH